MNEEREKLEYDLKKSQEENEKLKAELKALKECQK
jgi:hypothetical protein